VGAALLARDLELWYPASEAGADAMALDIDVLRVEAGESVGITGPSGAGKTSLLQVLTLGWQAAAVLSHVLQAKTGVAFAASLSMAELRLVGGIVLIGATLALLPASLAYRRPVSSLLRA
jgi:ABC-type transport system involved in cytochrome bd biosynthesis fused ATPase/permease subunit